MTIILNYGDYQLFMAILMASAAFIGLVHSLAPGHWLPVVLMAKGRKWSLSLAILGACVTAFGHVLLSVFLGGLSILMGATFFAQYAHEIEKYSGLVLATFGAFYAVFSYIKHARCHGHTHHGPEPESKKAPFLFLFSLGLSPCVAAFPVFGLAAASGSMSLFSVFIAFSIGVFAALVGATFLVIQGLVKLDHPIFEHYGDVITGVGVVLMGMILFLIH